MLRYKLITLKPRKLDIKRLSIYGYSKLDVKTVMEASCLPTLFDLTSLDSGKLKLSCVESVLYNMQNAEIVLRLSSFWLLVKIVKFHCYQSYASRVKNGKS